MICFADTSFLCSVYRTQVHSERADAFMEKRTEPIPVSSFLLLEFRQSTRLQVWLHAQDRKKGFSEKEATQMLRDLDSDLRTKVLEVVAVDWAAVHQLGDELSTRHTAQHGHRLTDMVHMATALHLGAEEFLTFDADQKRLAEVEGLSVSI